MSSIITVPERFSTSIPRYEVTYQRAIQVEARSVPVPDQTFLSELVNHFDQSIAYLRQKKKEIYKK